MRIELAPMEGITTYVYRNAFLKYYGGVETYFSPFISTHKDKELNFKEKKEIRPENNEGIDLIPQVLTANADEFIYTSGQIAKYGYNYININFGCPSGTVTTKGKGSGALLDTDKLSAFLDDIFSQSDLKISVKTRMGYSDPSEFDKLIKIYEKYPLEELIVHARVREDFYNGNARVEELAGVDLSKVRLSYNGDIYSVDDFERICERFPGLEAVMIGRGIISRPWLASQINSTMTKGKVSDISTEEGLQVFKSFNKELVNGYDAIMPGEKNTLFKLKELWVYMIKPFEQEECIKDINAKKLLKSIRKCNSLSEYNNIISSL